MKKIFLVFILFLNSFFSEKLLSKDFELKKINNIFSNSKKNLKGFLKNNWKKILFLHFSGSVFGTYRWVNYICPNKKEDHVKRCTLDSFFSNLIPFFYDLIFLLKKEELKNKKIFSSIARLNCFLPFYIRQEIANFCLKKNKKQ